MSKLAWYRRDPHSNPGVFFAEGSRPGFGTEINGLDVASLSPNAYEVELMYTRSRMEAIRPYKNIVPRNHRSHLMTCAWCRYAHQIFMRKFSQWKRDKRDDHLMKARFACWIPEAGLEKQRTLHLPERCGQYVTDEEREAKGHFAWTITDHVVNDANGCAPELPLLESRFPRRKLLNEDDYWYPTELELLAEEILLHRNALVQEFFKPFDIDGHNVEEGDLIHCACSWCSVSVCVEKIDPETRRLQKVRYVSLLRDSKRLFRRVGRLLNDGIVDVGKQKDFDERYGHLFQNNTRAHRERSIPV